MAAVPVLHGDHGATLKATTVLAMLPEAIAAEARLDGIYVIRTNLPVEQSDAASTVRSYKSLARVERAFRCMTTVDLDLRPVFHWTAPRVRAHALLCMLAYYLEWHMRQALAPLGNAIEFWPRSAGQFWPTPRP